ncbi:MAG: glutaredoxin family protein [Cellvibrionaceae bacterium]
MKKVILFSTLGCHLCDKAKSLVFPIASQLNYQVEEIDIADSERLVERYGVSIPVLGLLEEGKSMIDGSVKEMFWPFDADQITSFLMD